MSVLPICQNLKTAITTLLYLLRVAKKTIECEGDLGISRIGCQYE